MQHPKLKIKAVLCFLLTGGILLGAALFLAEHLYPRKPTLADLLSLLSQRQQPAQPWWKRWFDSQRPPMLQAQRSPAKKRRIMTVSVPAGRHIAGATPIPQPRLALRETWLAQLILCQRFATTKKDAWQVVQRASANVPGQEYEQKRFLCELLWIQYLDHINRPQILAALEPKCLELVKAREANFEDQLNAGLALLFNGKAKQAIPYLQTTLRIWPAKDRSRGNAYLGLAAAQAILGNGTEVNRMMKNFKTNFPDWLFVETYVPDLEDLAKTYQSPPLLLALHGKLMALTADIARAGNLYGQALNAPGLSIRNRALILNWRQQLITPEKP